MAKSAVGTILGLGVAGVAAWWIYENYFAVSAATAATPAAGTPPTSPAGASSGTYSGGPTPTNPPAPPVPPRTATIVTRSGVPVTLTNPQITNTPVIQGRIAGLLANAAQGNAYLQNGQMNAYQWEYLLENSLQKPASPNFNTAFPNPNALITPQQFASALGLGGLRRGMGAIVPASMRHNPGGNYRFNPRAWPVTRMIA